MPAACWDTRFFPAPFTAHTCMEAVSLLMVKARLSRCWAHYCRRKLQAS